MPNPSEDFDDIPFPRSLTNSASGYYRFSTNFIRTFEEHPCSLRRTRVHLRFEGPLWL
jgi:hypothetical protein